MGSKIMEHLFNDSQLGQQHCLRELCLIILVVTLVVSQDAKCPAVCKTVLDNKELSPNVRDLRDTDKVEY